MDHYHETKHSRRQSRKGITAVTSLVGMAVLSLWQNSDHASIRSFQTNTIFRMMSNMEQQQRDTKDATFNNLNNVTSGDDDNGGKKQSLSSSFHNNNNSATLDGKNSSSTTSLQQTENILNMDENHNTFSSTRTPLSPNMTDAHKTDADDNSSEPESSTNHRHDPISSPTNNTSINQRVTTTDDGRVLTIVVQLSGELGNQVFKIANGLCVQDHVEKELGIPTKLVLRAQDHGKWKHAMEWTKEAFPKTRPFDFREGNTPEFDSIHQMQEKWVDRQLASSFHENLALLKKFSCSESSKCYAQLLNLLNETWYLDEEHNKDQRPPTIPPNSNFSIPHVYVTDFVGHYCWDRMYDTYREFFQIDQQAICRQVPDPDESVLHLRNFLVEMPRRGKRLGFEQMGPNVTASRIFRNYQKGDKVAIISRYPDKISEFIDAMKEEKGIQARYIEGQTGNQDFCFLWKAQKEIIGQKISTFVSLAGMLGNAKKVRLYSVESLDTRIRSVHFFNYTFENEALRKRIVFENYNLTH